MEDAPFKGEDDLSKERLFALADGYAALSGVTVRKTSPSNALRNASGGRVRLYDDLKSGGTTTFKNYDRCVQWFSDNWPENEDWPADIRRPTPNNLKETANGE